MSKSLLLIVNPVAGKMRSRTAFFDITNVFCKAGYSVSLRITQRRGAAVEYAKQAGGFDRVVCVGGDGTLREVVKGLLDEKLTTPLGYIPSGSTNDFAASAGLPLEEEKAAMRIVEGRVRGLDIGVFNDTYFTYIASFGAFTSVSYSTPQQTKNALGHFAYIMEGIKDIQNIRANRLVINADSKTYRGNYIFGAISNSTSFGGVVKLNSKLVDMGDGVFEVMMIKIPKNLSEFNTILYSLSTSEFDNDMFDFFKASELSLSSSEPSPWSLDGEYRRGAEKIKVKNLHGAINFVS